MNHKEIIILTLVAVLAITVMLFYQSSNAGAVVIISESVRADESVRFPGYLPSPFRLPKCNFKLECQEGYQCATNRYDPYYGYCMPTSSELAPRMYWPVSLRS